MGWWARIRERKKEKDRGDVSVRQRERERKRETKREGVCKGEKERERVRRDEKRKEVGWARVQRGERGGTADAATGIKLPTIVASGSLFSVTLSSISLPFSLSLLFSLSAYALFFSPHLLRQMSHAPIKNNGGRRAPFFPPAC